jgi:phenylalanyl-tRNA synthetase beta chain
MNVSYEWLRAFVPIDATPAQLRDLLTAHTAAVEGLVPLRDDLAPIVVARVAEVSRHPDSDHLWLTKVDAGSGELLEVVCGAPIVTAGALYPFAMVGTTMPNGMKIERRKIRGIVSNGMLCSARELGLGEDHAGILELSVSAAPGTPFLSAMPVGDVRLQLDVGANRPDLLSHMGVARELTAITGTKWHLPEIPSLAPEIPKAQRAQGKGATAGIEVRVDADTKTRRYMGAVIRGVRIAASPEWLVRRLEAVGVRSINNVVDATNYVLHELGQPIHAFDLQKIAGAVVVRRAAPNEKLVTLDGISRALPAGSVVIADNTRAHAVAGVMGGKESEVTDDTRDLFVEVASFDPKLTRVARRALGLSTDASYRFERGVDPELAPLAMDRVVRLIIGLAGGSIAEPPADVVGTIPKPPEVALRATRVAQVLGADVPMDQSRRYLEEAGFEILSKSDRELRVRVPSWRTDVTSEVDLVEEVARFHGYDKFPVEIRPFRPTTTFDDPLWIVADRLREALVGMGLYETRPMPFVHGADDTHVRVGNPLSENEAYLRHSLLETLARRAEYNLSHRVGDVRLFEIGSAFARGKSAMPREQMRLGVLLMGRRRPPHFSEPQPPLFDEWDAKAVAEVAAGAAYPGQRIELAPGSGGDVLWQVDVAGKRVGNVVRAALDAPVWSAPAFGIELILGDMESAPAAERGAHAYIEGTGTGRPEVARYRALPTMPPAEIDLALVVPSGTSVADVERVIRSAAGELLEALDLFDQYTGAGVDRDHRSLAWRLTFRHPERTLRDKEIEGRRNKILSALEQELHVRQRTA